MMWWNHGDWSVGNWLAMGLMMLVFWSLIIGLIMWVVRSLSDTPAIGAGHPQAATPEVVLSQRFARGEIDEDEFVRRQALLRSSGVSAPPSRSS